MQQILTNRSIPSRSLSKRSASKQRSSKKHSSNKQYTDKTVAGNKVTSSLDIHLEKMPGIFSLYRRSILPKKSTFTKALGHIKSGNASSAEKAKFLDQIQSISVELNNIRPNPAQVSKYSDICGYNFNGETLPFTYPHILSFNLQLELMLNKAFPLPVIGLVHVRNRIERFNKLSLSDILDIRVFLSDSRFTEKGLEFDLTTEVLSSSKVAWQSVSTYLYRIRRTSPNSNQPRQAQHDTDYEGFLKYKEFWNLKESLGRQYAKVSGDSNPIHMHSLTAKLFGFKQAIAHGMWTKARAFAALSPLIKEEQVCMEVEFKQPVNLPSQVCMTYVEESTNRFNLQIKNNKGDKIHMLGRVTGLSDQD